MKKNYFDRFEIFINIVWGFIIAGVIIQLLSYKMTLPELVSFVIAFFIALYPLSTFLSKNLFKKAIRERKIIAFGFYFFSITFLSACFIVILYLSFNYLEDQDVFTKSAISCEKNTILHDLAGAFISVLFLNFGFCGLRFFEENLKLKKTLIDSQLQILQAQINPHFMFNVLNHVNVLIRKEPDLASSLLILYTNILRYQLQNGKKETVDIRQEVDFLKNFIEVEKVRWKNNLQVNCEWNIEVGLTMIPPLLFITFVENAFKHVSRSKREKGFVNISLNQRENKLIFKVENSKFADGNYPKTNSSGIGLVNIQKRLDILFPGKYSLKIENSNLQYKTNLTLEI